MKRIIVLLLALTLILSACGKKVDDATDNTTESSLGTSETSGSADKSTTDTTEEEISTDSTGESAPDTTEESTSDTTEESASDTTEDTDETESGSVTDENTEPDTPAPPHNHDYHGTVTTQPGCGKAGIKTFTCACGASYTEAVAALSHSWGDWATVIAPTADAAGAAKRTCKTCGKEEEKALSKLPSAQPEQLTISDQVLERIKQEFLNLVNLERSGKQLNQLTLNGELDRVAAIRDDEIQELFSHTRPNGELYYSLVDESAYPYMIVGENICMTSHVGSGSYTAADKWVGSQSQIEAAAAWTFVLFKNSPGHYANMIHEEYQDCGIGISYEVENGIPYFYTAHIFGAR